VPVLWWTVAALVLFTWLEVPAIAAALGSLRLGGGPRAGEHLLLTMAAAATSSTVACSGATWTLRRDELSRRDARRLGLVPAAVSSACAVVLALATGSSAPLAVAATCAAFLAGGLVGAASAARLTGQGDDPSGGDRPPLRREDTA
jgi:uncharacterized membrane protein